MRSTLPFWACSHRRNMFLGDEVAQFEQEFAAFCGTKHAIAVNTGTSALHLALLAAGVGPGDEVITVPFTFVATVSAICYAGARPVLVDVEPATLTMDPAKLEAAITPRTKAIVPVHLYGQMADMTSIMQIANRHGIAVIEDACQAHGAEYKGRRAGSIGLSGCFSFYPGKNLGACGEGGMVVTNDDEHAKTMRMLRDWGQDRRYHQLSRASTIAWTAFRERSCASSFDTSKPGQRRAVSHARRYSTLLAGSRHCEDPVEAAGRRHVYHIYAVRTAGSRWPAARFAQHEGMQSGLHYPIPVHLQKAHADLGYASGDFPVSERAAREVLSLPIYPEMTSDQIEQVAAAVEQMAMSD